MSTDTDWLEPILDKFSLSEGSRKDYDEIKATILQHESQAVKAADKIGRIDELQQVHDNWRRTYQSEKVQDAVDTRINQLQGDSGLVGGLYGIEIIPDDDPTGATPPVTDHRTDMEL